MLNVCECSVDNYMGMYVGSYIASYIASYNRHYKLQQWQECHMEKMHGVSCSTIRQLPFDMFDFPQLGLVPYFTRS